MKPATYVSIADDATCATQGMLKHNIIRLLLQYNTVLIPVADRLIY